MTATSELRPVTSWGRVKRHSVPVARPRFNDELDGVIGAPERTMLGIGLGRSYGDSALNGTGQLVDMTALDRIIAFDTARGVIRADAGLTVTELLRVTVPQGWFLPTTPGTRYVTLGGAVANDVHGKNHHAAGTFGRSVLRIGLCRSDRGAIEIGPDCEPELFAATVAGLGLTGLIGWVELKLAPIGSAYLTAETVPFSGYAEFLRLAEDSAARFEHTVAWIDCTSGQDAAGTRGLFSRGNWLTDGWLVPHRDRTLASLPLELPAFAINRWTLKAFNTLYYAAGKLKGGRQRVHYAPFFYPLDQIRNWNRAYGRSGFYQYQCVVPTHTADAAIPDMLREIAASGQGSCLAVLKTFGDKRSPGLLSFPFEGVTLALDFPNRSASTHLLFERLDEIVTAAQGRLYPAKDGRMPAAMFRAGYPALETFSKQIDPKFQSDFWRRMTR